MISIHSALRYFGTFGGSQSMKLPDRQNRPLAPQLTPREREVLTWTAAGKTAPEIAIILALSQSTITQYVKSACKKLDATNKSHAVAIAVSRNIIKP